MKMELVILGIFPDVLRLLVFRLVERTFPMTIMVNPFRNA